MWAGQTDADEMGMDYDTLDSVLALHIDGGVPAAATADRLGIPLDVVETVREMYETSAHKRAMPPGPEPLY
jgi:NAD+ synthase